MTGMMHRASMIIAAVTAVSGVMIAAAGPVWAHGVHSTGPGVGSFLISGMAHMLLGWDHLLFIAGVALVSARVKPAVKLLSLFALGHSTTLIMASLAGWQVNPVFVDVVIALSLVFVGVAGWRPPPFRWFALAVFGFGLVHGLGLATRLQALDLPENGVLTRVIAFNVGVELAQLIALVYAISLWMLLLYRIDGSRLRRAAYAGLAVVGVIAAGTLTINGYTQDESPSTAGAHYGLLPDPQRLGYPPLALALGEPHM